MFQKLILILRLAGFLFMDRGHATFIDTETPTPTYTEEPSSRATSSHSFNTSDNKPSDPLTYSEEVTSSSDGNFFNTDKYTSDSTTLSENSPFDVYRKLVSVSNKETTSESESKSDESDKNLNDILQSSVHPYLRSIFGYLYIEPVNCSECFWNGTCYKRDGYSVNLGVYFFESEFEEIKTKMTESAVTDDIHDKISELSFMESVLYDLYREIIYASKRFACTLETVDGSYALKLCRTYFENRVYFIRKIKDLIESINFPRNVTHDIFNYAVSDYKEMQTQANVDFSDIKLYENNAIFAKNLISVLELIYNLTLQEQEIKYEKYLINKEADLSKSFPDIKLLTKTVRKLRHLEDLYNSSMTSIRTIKLMLEENKQLNNTFNTSAVSGLMDMDRWMNNFMNSTLQTDMWMLHLDNKKSLAVFYDKAEIILLGIFFVIGIIGNGLLVIIFIRHNEIRTPSNIMLLNIAITDILFLLVNIFVFCNTDKLLDEVLCKVYHFLRTLCIGSYVYSLVMISFQRFLVLSVFYRRGGCLRNKSKCVLIFYVWFISIFVAIPYGFLSGTENGDSCYDIKYKEVEYRAGSTLFDLIVLCIVPLCLITLFNGLTITEDDQGLYHNAKYKLKRMGVLTSDILVGLSFIFVITYVPFYMFRFAFVWSDTKVDILYYEYILFIMPFLVYLNSCLNPIALYIMCKQYRSYFNLYILCGREEASVNIGQKSVINVSTRTIESNL